MRHCRVTDVGYGQTLLHGFAFYNPSYTSLVRSSVRCIHNDEARFIFTKIQRYGEVLVILALGWGCKEKRKKQRHVGDCCLVGAGFASDVVSAKVCDLHSLFH